MATIHDAETGVMIGSRVLITNHPHIQEYPDLVYFTLKCTEPLPTSADFEKFDTVQNRIDELAYEWEFCCLGMITCYGHRDWVGYAKDAQRLMGLMFVEFSAFSPQMESEPDPNWTHYRQLLKQK